MRDCNELESSNIISTNVCVISKYLSNKYTSILGNSTYKIGSY